MAAKNRSARNGDDNVLEIPGGRQICREPPPPPLPPRSYGLETARSLVGIVSDVFPLETLGRPDGTPTRSMVRTAVAVTYIRYDFCDGGGLLKGFCDQNTYRPRRRRRPSFFIEHSVQPILRPRTSFIGCILDKPATL